MLIALAIPIARLALLALLGAAPTAPGPAVHPPGDLLAGPDTALEPLPAALAKTKPQVRALVQRAPRSLERVTVIADRPYHDGAVALPGDFIAAAAAGSHTIVLVLGADGRPLVGELHDLVFQPLATPTLTDFDAAFGRFVKGRGPGGMSGDASDLEPLHATSEDGRPANQFEGGLVGLGGGWSLELVAHAGGVWLGLVSHRDTCWDGGGGCVQERVRPFAKVFPAPRDGRTFSWLRQPPTAYDGWGVGAHWAAEPRIGPPPGVTLRPDSTCKLRGAAAVTQTHADGTELAGAAGVVWLSAAPALFADIMMEEGSFDGFEVFAACEPKTRWTLPSATHLAVAGGNHWAIQTTNEAGDAVAVLMHGDQRVGRFGKSRLVFVP